MLILDHCLHGGSIAAMSFQVHQGLLCIVVLDNQMVTDSKIHEGSFPFDYANSSYQSSSLSQNETHNFKIQQIQLL